MTPGEKLREWRGTRTQVEVAERLGVTQGTIARLERGDGHPQTWLAVAIEKMTKRAVLVEDWPKPERE